jgi:predicted nucleic acid-binding protein
VTRILLDLNAVMDVLLARPAHVDNALRLWSLALSRSVEVAFPAHGVTTLYYLARRAGDAATAKRVVNELLNVASIVPIDASVLRRARDLDWPDFEDAVCASAAEAAGCDLLVTRDPGGYPRSPVNVIDPAGALLLLADPSAPGGVREKARPYRAGRRPRRS